MKRFAAVLAGLFLTTVCHAYNPPEDSAEGVTARIGNVPETVDFGKPFEFTVQVEQTGTGSVNGAVSVWLNDDWTVTGSATALVNMTGKGDAEFTFTATPLPRQLSAHYPVHARAEFLVNGVPVTLHPIAIFKVNAKPRTAESEQPSVASVLEKGYTCLRAPAGVTVDGNLDEWGNAVPVPCNTGGQSTGTISPESLDGIFYAMHDDATLYVALRVSDDDISCTDNKSEDFMNSDYVRLYLSAKDPASRRDADLGKDDVVMAINVFGGDTKPTVKLPNYGFTLRAGVDLSTCTFAAKKTSAGYNLEVAIPKQLVGEGLANGATAGFNMMLGDSDSGRRRGELTLGRRVPRYWLTPQSYVQLQLSADSALDLSAIKPPLNVLSARTYQLERLTGMRVGLTRNGKTEYRPVGWHGNHKDSGISYSVRNQRRGDVELPAINIHPPYRGGTGAVWGEYYLQFPDETPITLEFLNAIRDHAKDEPASDGVEFKILATPDGGAETELSSTFTDSKTWQAGSADLSAYAGKTVLLKLWAGPGPANNTCCDSGYWGAPTLVVGKKDIPIDEDTWQARVDAAAKMARSALAGKRVEGAWRLEDGGEPLGAAFVPGDKGLLDGVIVFADDERTLGYRGFTMHVDSDPIGDWRSESTLTGVNVKQSRRKIVVDHFIETPDGPVTARAVIRSEKGTVTLEFSMPHNKRSKRGTPRFTKLALGPASIPLYRLYAGFGNVIEEPEAGFAITAGGFRLSTRHVGADYRNGISLLQATRLFPDRLVCRPDENLFSLETRHDATFRLIPSTNGAFTAARHYRDLAGFKPGKGVRNLKGRMCIDQWGGRYDEAATGLDKSGKYGLNHSIFVKHVWQRWGYDYRLPDIYPPAHGLAAFNLMPTACEKHGIFFAPHDNYIDFYPDADNYSYDHMVFNADGSPQRAWFNKGRKAQSYRWAPHAFIPWLKKNMKLLRKGAHPNGLFIDVFSAIRPIDYYDRDGNYYTRERTTKEWCDAFDTSRKILGRGSIMLSEAGHDALIGSLDGAQSDHYSADRWGVKAAAMTRTPWHDMASHGTFVLLAGGLGHRYGNKDQAHTYGTDDYLSNTVIGGRNPMCDGPFSRRTVMTYWLLHDVCNDLAHADFEIHEFADNTVYRQHTTFSDGSQVWTNRGNDSAWTVEGHMLPQYGLYVRTPQAAAAICEIDGQRAAYARSDDALFVDARPPFNTGQSRSVEARTLGGEYLGNGTFRIRVEWNVIEPLEPGLRAFVHVCHPKVGRGENILHHGSMSLDTAALTRKGRVPCDINLTIPPDSFGGEYTVRYGLYKPGAGGYRVMPRADMDGARVRGGKLDVEIKDKSIVSGAYIEESPMDYFKDLNLAQRPLDFGGIVTNGAFRFLTPARGSLTLIPLPGSIPFKATVDLKQFHRNGGAMRGVEAIDITGSSQGPVPHKVNGHVVDMELDAQAFAYRLLFE